MFLWGASMIKLALISSLLLCGPTRRQTVSQPHLFCSLFSTKPASFSKLCATKNKILTNKKQMGKDLWVCFGTIWKSAINLRYKTKGVKKMIATIHTTKSNNQLRCHRMLLKRQLISSSHLKGLSAWKIRINNVRPCKNYL